MMQIDKAQRNCRAGIDCHLLALIDKRHIICTHASQIEEEIEKSYGDFVHVLKLLAN